MPPLQFKHAGRRRSKRSRQEVRRRPVRYRDPATGKRKSVYGKTRKAAAARLAAKLAGADDPAPPRGQRLGPYLTTWLAGLGGIEPQTRDLYAFLVRHWVTHLGRAPLGGLTPEAVLAAQRAIEEGSGVASARGATKLLRRALRRQAARGYVRPGLSTTSRCPCGPTAGRAAACSTRRKWRACAGRRRARP